MSKATHASWWTLDKINQINFCVSCTNDKYGLFIYNRRKNLKRSEGEMIELLLVNHLARDDDLKERNHRFTSIPIPMGNPFVFIRERILLVNECKQCNEYFFRMNFHRRIIMGGGKKSNFLVFFFNRFVVPACGNDEVLKHDIYCSFSSCLRSCKREQNAGNLRMLQPLG